MRKARRSPRRALRSASPFALAGDMWALYMQAAELMQSSAEVILRRSAMMQRSLSGELPLDHQEYTRMWQEKMQAGGEAWAAFLRHGADIGNPGLSPAQLQSKVKGISQTMKPYGSKAKANAKRLRKNKP